MFVCFGAASAPATAAPQPPATQSKAARVDDAERAYLSRFYVFVDSAAIDAYLRDVAAKLLATRGKGDAVPDILVYSSDEFMASTDASGNLLVSTRALRDLESEDELAALLSHELSHLVLRHNERKSAMRNFPVGVETAGWVATAADQMQGGTGGAATRAGGRLDAFGNDALSNTQIASLVWSDILMPGWSRAQEREADRSGFDMMRTAGYDAAAFGTLFSKLQAAQARRSERLRRLQRVAEQKLAKRTTDDEDGPIAELTAKVKTKSEELAIDAVFDRLTRFASGYDPPERRQELLAAHADEQGGSRDKRPRSPRFRAQLRAGSGGAVLAADRAAIRVLAALNAGRRAEAAKAIAPLLPTAPGGRPMTPHLNLALGAWYQSSGNPGAAELRALDWLGARRPPAQAYLWRATYPWKRKEYSKVVTALEDGRRRIGSGASFLPLLVTTAKSQGDEGRAEKYTLECAAEDRRNPGAMMSAITFRGSVAPSGIYADCVRRLGREPQDEGLKGKTMQALKHPVDAGKGLTQKLRDRFRRKDDGAP
ncbi:MAG: M48 family metalloprotease [Burkholderiales bacterium]|nr:M48 family metalloprotease [Burkholderiales bacterium]